MEKISLTRNDLESYAKNEVGFCGLDLSRISGIFIVQVLQLQVNQTINTYQMLDEVRCLEGLIKGSSTKKVETFKRLPLKGLKKKHFIDASFITKNISAHFGSKYGGNKRLDDLVKNAFVRNKSGFIDDEFCGYIAHQSTIGMLEERASKNKITGEWVVFKEFKGQNYYLTLAAHDEGDNNIFERVNMAYDQDFSYLREKA